MVIILNFIEEVDELTIMMLETVMFGLLIGSTIGISIAIRKYKIES